MVVYLKLKQVHTLKTETIIPSTVRRAWRKKRVCLSVGSWGEVKRTLKSDFSRKHFFRGFSM